MWILGLKGLIAEFIEKNKWLRFAFNWIALPKVCLIQCVSVICWGDHVHPLLLKGAKFILPSSGAYVILFWGKGGFWAGRLIWFSKAGRCKTFLKQPEDSIVLLLVEANEYLPGIPECCTWSLVVVSYECIAPVNIKEVPQKSFVFRSFLFMMATRIEEQMGLFKQQRCLTV